jgi:elongator complex protein 3
MATTTITATTSSARRRDANLPSENERFLRCCADIANALIEDHEAISDPRQPKKDLNLNSLRARYAKKHKVGSMPPLTAIIAAVPEHYKKYILPKLVAKPIRKFSLCLS